MGWRRSDSGKLSSPATSGSGAYSNYKKSQSDAKANPNGYQTANNAVTRAAKELGFPEWWVQPALEIVARESSFNHKAKNPKSSAAGLFQFLDMTRKNYGGASVDWNDPYQQAVAGLKYIKDRYGDPIKALEHWDKKKFY